MLPHADSTPSSGSATPASGSGSGRAIVYIDPYRVPERRARGRPDPRHPRPLRPLLARRTSSGCRATAPGSWRPPPWPSASSGRVHSIAPGRDARATSSCAASTSPPWPPTTPRSATPTAASSTRARPGWVGYDLNVRGERLYHSGDTDVIPEMDSVTGVDVALLPVSGDLRDDGRTRRPRRRAGSSRGWPCRCTGASTSARVEDAARSPSGRRSRSGSWSGVD